MTCISVKPIKEAACGANPGGVDAQIWVIAKEDVDLTTFPAPAVDGSCSLTGDIVPKAGKGWARWDIMEDTGELIAESVGDPGNKSFKHSIEGYVPKADAEKSAIFQNILNRKCLVLVRDGNGNVRLAGDSKRFVYMDAKYTSGKKGTDKNGYTVTFSAEGLAHEPYYYNGVITEVAA
jgi:hypothetical protein